MDWIFPIVLGLVLFIMEWWYIHSAGTWGVVDNPNERSMHLQTTVRGGGFVFVLAALAFGVLYGWPFPWFFAGLVLVAIISYVDDIRHVRSGVRFLLHVLAVCLLFVENGLMVLPVYWILFFLLMAIAGLNAYNFMDGINGITAGYSLVTLGTLWYVNEQLVSFTDGRLILFLVSSLLVFSWFNFRKKALCFSGDIGSIGIAFILLFLTVQLIVRTGELIWILFFLLYGIDSLFTIVQRLLNKENITQAHKKHLFQQLVYRRSYTHLAVSIGYMLIQLAVNIVVIYIARQFSPSSIFAYPSLILIIFVAGGYLFLKRRLNN